MITQPPLQYQAPVAPYRHVHLIPLHSHRWSAVRILKRKIIGRWEVK